MLILAVDSALGWALRQSRIQYETNAQTNVSNLSKVLEQNLITLIKEIDLTLRTVADEEARVNAVSRPDYSPFEQFLTKQSALVPDVLGMRVVDQAGNLIYATNNATSQRLNVGDRDHFLRVREDPKADLVITGPILGRISNKQVLIFSRRISRPDGSFGGEVFASVEVDKISRMFSAVDLGPHGVVSLWDKTTTLARNPENVGEKSAIGTQKPSPQLKALLDAETRAAFYTATAPTDNVKKSYSIRRIDQFPLWVIAGMAEEDYLAPWKNEFRQAAVLALLFAILTTVFAWQIYRYWRVGKLIRETEQQLNNAQALAHVGSWIKDLYSGRYVWSDEVFRIFGYEPQSLAPNDALLLAAIHPDDKKELMAMLAVPPQIRGNQVSEFRIKRPDGSVRWVHAEGRAEPDGTGMPDRLTGFLRDVTESKVNELAIISAKEEWERTFDAVPDFIALIDTEHRIVRVNRAMAVRLGSVPERLVGRPCYELMHGTVAPPDFCPHARLLVSNAEERSEFFDRNLNGFFEVRTTPLRDRDGQLIGSVHIVRDVTEHRKLEEQLRQAQKMEAVGQLAGGVAHDFNNILTAIIGYGSIILMQLAKDDPNRTNVEHILEASDRATHLIKDLLLFSRQHSIVRKPVDLNGIINRIKKFLIRVIGEDIVFDSRLSPKELVILGDSHQIEQVLMNLATNANDAMPKGGTFTITTEEVLLDEKFTPTHGLQIPGRYALIRVSDTGHGMDNETRQRIFEPFFTTKEVGKGTGLGLSVVYGIVQQHGGYINVHSDQTKGTTFQIYLPLIESVEAESEPTITAEQTVGGTETILMAEDNQSVRNLTNKILTHFGYTVIEAIDGEDAVKKYQENKDRIQLLLFDVIMPKMNGKEAYDEIRKIKPGIKVIFSSGFATDIIQQKVSLDKDSHLIYKPVSPLYLLAKVREVLDEDKS
ncbi:MAG: ATP-binding protein [Dissulfurispiraceae bacterium]